MSSLTAAGKLRKSRLADPTQCSGFSSAAGTRRTSRLSLFWDIQASKHSSLMDRVSANYRWSASAFSTRDASHGEHEYNPRRIMLYMA